MELMRVATAGSVDDGKSTLIGRLLHDSGSLPADTLAALSEAAGRHGLSEPDLAQVTDGLRAEREQGITIDVAYRYFTRRGRRFVLADTPGHVQYTRNMVTGASTADVAVLLVDARCGVLEQTRRHLAVAGLLRVPRLLLVVNKMDLVDYAEERFTAAGDGFRPLAGRLGLDVATVPVSALTGENVVRGSTAMPWYAGPTLLELLATAPLEGAPGDRTGLRLPVQTVLRDRTGGYRAYAGQVCAGTVASGDRVRVLPRGLVSAVAAVDGPGGPLTTAGPTATVALRLVDDLDVSRGDVIVSAGDVDPPQVTSRVDGAVAWFADDPLRAGSRWLLRAGTATVPARVTAVTARADLATLTPVPADQLAGNDIGRVRFDAAAPLVLDDYAKHRGTGAFLVVDETTGDTAGAGLAGPAAGGVV